MAKILIIDDDVSIGNMIETALLKAGHEAWRAYSGTEALLLLEKEQPELILLDLMLPGLSGEELLPKIREIPVIVVSAKVGIDDKVNMLLGGAVDYLTKPFELKELLARIEVQGKGKPDGGKAYHETDLQGGDACWPSGSPDENRVRSLKNFAPESRSGHRKVGAPRSDQRRHAGLHGSFPENAHQ